MDAEMFNYNPTPEEILAIPMQGNDAGAETIKGYLKALLERLWREGEEFSGKRPFGNSGWEEDIYEALAEAGFDEADPASMNDAIYKAIDSF